MRTFDESTRRNVRRSYARLLPFAVIVALGNGLQVGSADAHQVFSESATAHSHVSAQARATSVKWASASVTIGANPAVARSATASARASAVATAWSAATARVTRSSTSRPAALRAASQAAHLLSAQRAHTQAYALALGRARTSAQTRALAAAHVLARKNAELAAAAAAAAATGAGTGTGTGTSACGGEHPAGAGTCTFDDEFNGASLDRNLWTVQTTAASAFHGGDACTVDDPDTMSVSGGNLYLSVVKAAEPFTCSDPQGNFDTQYNEGSVTTNQGFGQAYGRYEIRARFPDSSTPGLQSALWLWPQNAAKYGPSYPGSGEIDIAEQYSAFSDLAVPFIHYIAAQADPNVTKYNCRIDTGQFNTYTLQWTATTLTIMVNGSTCLVDTWHSVGSTASAPFDSPFMINLTEELGIGNNAFDPANPAPLPATMQVDYVRVWKDATTS